MSKCWCSCNSTCSCVPGCMLADWTPSCSHARWPMSATCDPWFVPRSNVGLSKHGDPVIPHFCPLNQNLAHVRTEGGRGGYLPASHHPLGDQSPLPRALLYPKHRVLVILQCRFLHLRLCLAWAVSCSERPVRFMDAGGVALRPLLGNSRRQSHTSIADMVQPQASGCWATEGESLNLCRKQR